MLTIALSKADWMNLAYLVAAVMFIFGLKYMSSVKTAARGNAISALGMLLACVITLFYLTGATAISLVWIGAGVLIGSAVGLVLALKTPMTGMPQMVALLNGFGGIASLLVACGDYLRHHNLPLLDKLQARAHAGPVSPELRAQFSADWQNADPEIVNQLLQYSTQPWHVLLTIGLAILIGGVTFTGSLVAFGKLQGLKITPSKPVQFQGQKALIALLLLGSLGLAGCFIAQQGLEAWPLYAIVIISLILGILLVIGIGGADMPVVISLLNSYSGIAASMAGFVLNNECLIITGALVGASGIILTRIMCKAMNRSLANVLFGGVGGTSGKKAAAGEGPVGEAREMTIEDVAIQLDAASQVMIVPGYGMAVAQAQHPVADLGKLLAERGVTVKYAIHPVAGRMPGHMNVLLAEADVPYEQLCDLDQSNPEFEQTDVALIIGANDVTNPAARHAKDSPIYGMPILDVDKSRSVVVIKRSLNPGFAGIENELYYKDNCGMLFGDAKKMVTQLLAELKAE